MELDERNKKVLQAVIDSYISSGLPVGSNVLVKRYEFGVSSATLRNIMAELEELGLLMHPHTSAGRVPTERGYRYYIDSLISFAPPGEEEQLIPTREGPALHNGDIQELMEEASRFLATLSHYAGVVVAPSEPEGRYKHIEFVRLRGRQVLLIFVTNTGLVQNKLIDLDEQITQSELNYFSSYLDDELEHWSLPEIRHRLVEKLREEKQVFMRLMDEVERASQDVEREPEKVYIGGASQILESPEFATVDSMRSLFKALEDKYNLLKVLDRSAAADGIKVFVGSENPMFEMQGCSLVVGSYKAGANIVGTLGVIGPTRMQYRQVIQVVDYTSRLLSRLLGERFERGLE